MISLFESLKTAYHILNGSAEKNLKQIHDTMGNSNIEKQQEIVSKKIEEIKQIKEAARLEHELLVEKEFWKDFTTHYDDVVKYYKIPTELRQETLPAIIGSNLPSISTADKFPEELKKAYDELTKPVMFMNTCYEGLETFEKYASPVNYERLTLSYHVDVRDLESTNGLSRAFEKFRKENQNSLYEKIIELMNLKSLKHIKGTGDLCRVSGVTSQTLSKIRNMDIRPYAPGKETIVALCLALQLSLLEAQELLAIAGFTLSNEFLIDQIIAFCLEAGYYDIYNINVFIYAKTGKNYLMASTHTNKKGT